MRNVFFFFLFLLATLPVRADEALTLEQSYRLALARSSAVAVSEEEIRAAHARFAEVLGAILPQLTFKASDFFQQNPGTSGAGVPNTFVRTSRPEMAINVVQPLFQGLKEFQSLHVAHADAVRTKALEADAKRHLFYDVATAFFTVAKVEQDVSTLERTVNVLRTRSQELVKRVALGKSRESERLAQDTDLALLEAELARQQGLRSVAYELLAFLTGTDATMSIVWNETVAQTAPPIETSLTAADHRPDIEATDAAVTMAAGTLQVRRGDFLPRLDAEANYYPYRVGFQKDIRWDAKLTLSVPIFNWGTVGGYREAAAKLRQSQVVADDARRVAQREVKQAYATYQASVHQLEKYNTAIATARQSYDAILADDRLGLVTNLDVLSAERSWFEAERLANDARVQVWLDWTTLHVAAGTWPP